MIGGGLLLLAAALLLAGGNFLEADRAALASEQVLQQMEPPAPAEADPPEEPEEVVPAYVLNPDMEMPETEVDGHRYIGVLEISSLELSLPVMNEWSYPRLKLAPCRYSGSAYTGNLVIAAHNYRTHFGPIKNLTVGAQVTFTDVKGRRFSYEVSAVETIEATSVEDAVSNAWDLTLITCTPGGQARVAVRCLRADEMA